MQFVTGCYCYHYHSAVCNDGQIRLQDGIHLDSWTGILEVCFNQRWGAVISSVDADAPLAQVLCRQLGYLSGKGQHTVTEGILMYT